MILSLCDYSGVMVQPWLDAGFLCTIVDIQHPEGAHVDGPLMTVGADIRTWLPPLNRYDMVFAFPPCTHLAVSGAKHFQRKGLGKLVEGIELVEACRRICEWSNAPWMLENPVSTLATYWRKPDHYFDPCDYGDPYRKKTCLWTGNGFVMPDKQPVEPVEKSPIHWASPGPERANFRSRTPEGFAKAVFRANARLVAA